MGPVGTFLVTPPSTPKYHEGDYAQKQEHTTAVHFVPYQPQEAQILQTDIYYQPCSWQTLTPSTAPIPLACDHYPDWSSGYISPEISPVLHNPWTSQYVPQNIYTNYNAFSGSPHLPLPLTFEIESSEMSEIMDQGLSHPGTDAFDCLSSVFEARYRSYGSCPPQKIEGVDMTGTAHPPSTASWPPRSPRRIVEETRQLSESPNMEDILSNTIQRKRNRRHQSSKTSKSYDCHECGRSCGRQYNLLMHLRTHDPDRPRPFDCRIEGCTQAPFARQHDLQRHIDTKHKKQLQYTCPFCSNTFGRKDTMIRHVDKLCRAKIRSGACGNA